MALFKPVIALASAAWLVVAANSGIEAPRIGFVRLADENVWALRGVAGSFYYGERMATRIDRMAFNGFTGVRTSAFHTAELLGASGEVMRTVRIDGEVRLIGLSPLEAGSYVLTDTEIWRLQAGAVNRYLVPSALPEGRLVGLSGAGAYVEFAAVRDGQVALQRLWLDSGEMLTRETFAAQPEILLILKNGSLLWSEGDTIVLRRPDASLANVETGSHIVSLHQVGAGWFQATGDDGRQFGVRLTQGGSELLVNLLPETAQ